MDGADLVRALLFGGLLAGFLLLVAGAARGRAWLLALAALAFFVASVPGLVGILGIFLAVLGVAVMAAARLVAGEPHARWPVARAGTAILAALLLAWILHLALRGPGLVRPNLYEMLHLALAATLVLQAWWPVRAREKS